MEPNYDPDRIRQNQDVTNYIQRLGEKVMDQWRRRDEIRAELQAGKKFDQRTRNVFYDTDNILEKQHETVRICTECGGAWRIASTSDRSNLRSLGIHIPRRACKACRETGHEWYDTADKNSFDIVMLQDLYEDKFLKKNFWSGS